MKKKFSSLALFMIVMLVMSGCESSSAISSSDSLKGSAYSNNMTMDGAYDASENYEYASDEEVNSEADIVKNTMMTIRDANVSVDVSNLEEFHSNIDKQVQECDGYFEESEVKDYSNEYAEYRYAYYRIRIPADRLDSFLNIVDGSSTVTSKSISVEDVSLEYVDIQAHIKALEDEQSKLNDILRSASEVSDIIEIEDRLTQVQYQLDSINGRKRYLEGRVSYSTVVLNAREKRNINHPIRAAFEVNFKESMIEGIENAVYTLVAIIAGIPVIIIVTAFVILFLWILKKVLRKVFKRKEQKVQYVVVQQPDVNDE